MAITTESYEPTDRLPHYGQGEWQTGHVIGDGTLRVFTGNGELGRIRSNVNIAGTIDFHDADADDTLDATNRIVRASSAVVDTVSEEQFTVRKGLAIVTSAETADVTFQLRGRPTVSSRNFGT